jgi:hypothetical protein
VQWVDFVIKSGFPEGKPLFTVTYCRVVADGFAKNTVHAMVAPCDPSGRSMFAQ